MKMLGKKFRSFIVQYGISLAVIAMLSLMAIMAVCSMRGDSLTMDELAHLPAGYAYLTQKDMRLNPEHPPLLKDLAAIPLLFIKNIHFPSDTTAWKKDINGQWVFGFHLLYNSDNPTEKMIFWGRIPMIIITLLVGVYIFKWSREIFGDKAALIALFLFSFSPTFIAHGRLVTTDVGASLGTFIATYYFVKFLKEKTRKNLVIAGIAFGLAELTKFSLILLFPLFAVIVFAWSIVQSDNFLSFKKNLFTLCRDSLIIVIIGYLVIFPIYQYHVLNYPPEKQVSDTRFILSSFKIRPIANLVVWMADKPILRPYAQYALGVLMATQRASGGNTTYFLGEVSASGWKTYFPFVYLIKESLTFHILTIIALLYLAWAIKEPFWQKPFERTKNWVKNHLPEFSMLAFIGIYWFTSLTSNLNIGVRHLLPIFPFTMILVSGMISKILQPPYLRYKYFFLGCLVLWQISSMVCIYPHFLAYFNEIIGGPDNGYLYTVDSNLDWGQDLKRLKKWVDEKGIKKIYVDYFGGSHAPYYLEEKYAPWRGTNKPEDFPKGNYLAVSATFLQEGRGIPVSGFNQDWGYYFWLNQYTPVAKIGYSIFVFYID